MQEPEIVSHLEQVIAVADVQIQVVWQEDEFLVIFNRSGEEPLDYWTLSQQVMQTLRNLPVSLPPAITFYSRVLGTYEPDWEHTVRVVEEHAPATVILSARSVAPPTQAPTPAGSVPSPKIAAPEPSPEVTAETIILGNLFSPEELASLKESPQEVAVPASSGSPRSLQEYCFTPNKHLLKTPLPAPELKVAEAVVFFHRLGESTQLRLAPILEGFFRDPEEASALVPPEIRTWMTALQKLGTHEFKSVAVWLSRYCDNKKDTLARVSAVLQPTKAQSTSQSSQTPSPEEIAPVNPPRRSPWLVIAAVVTLVGVVGAIAIGISVRKNDPPQKELPNNKRSQQQTVAGIPTSANISS